MAYDGFQCDTFQQDAFQNYWETAFQPDAFQLGSDPTNPLNAFQITTYVPPVAVWSWKPIWRPRRGR